MGERKLWPALLLEGGASAFAEASADRRSLGGGWLAPPTSGPTVADLVSVTLDEFSPVAIQDLTELPLPPGGLWDPTFPPPPESPPGPLNWRVFFSSPIARDAAQAALKVAHPSVTTRAEDVVDDDWAARSQREMTAIRVGAFIVAPPWDVPANVADGSTVVVIEPSRGFGTGHHASTRLCLRALSDTNVRGARVLDLGTGSGVLAMAAARRGAREVVAVDVDGDAIDAARESAALNQDVQMIEWLVGDFRHQQTIPLAGPWDLVLANLTGGMLMSSAARIGELAGDGLLIVSGFDESECATVKDALQMTVRAVFHEDGWVGLVLSS